MITNITDQMCFQNLDISHPFHMCRNPANIVKNEETNNSSIFDTALRNLEEQVYKHTE